MTRRKKTRRTCGDEPRCLESRDQIQGHGAGGPRQEDEEFCLHTAALLQCLAEGWSQTRATEDSAGGCRGVEETWSCSLDHTEQSGSRSPTL